MPSTTPPTKDEIVAYIDGYAAWANEARTPEAYAEHLELVYKADLYDILREDRPKLEGI